MRALDSRAAAHGAPAAKSKRTAARPAPAAPTPAPPSASTEAPLFIQRKAACACGGGCPGCGAEEESASALGQPLMKKAACACGGGCPSCKQARAGASSSSSTPSSSSSHAPAAMRAVRDVLRASGEPLDRASRGFFEPRFGEDFSRVRVHSDGAASESARSVGALAYTVGSHIVFGAGRYAPTTNEGRLLLAHELAHVVQQRGATHAHVQTSPDGGETSGEDEAEADAAAARVVAGQSVGGTLRARTTAALRRAVTAPILPFNQPRAQVCLVHLHRDEGNALHVAESIWTDYCANMVRLGGSPSNRCVNVTAGGRTCTADPNRVFSDAAIDADVPFGGECGCPTASRPAMRAELKAWRPQLEAAIGRCRGGSGSDISGPLPVVAFHNNSAGGSLSIHSFSTPAGTTAPTPDQLAAQEGQARLAPAAAMLSRIPLLPPLTNPWALTATASNPLTDPDNFLLVTDVADYFHFLPTHNVVLQGTTPETVRPSFDDGSLAVRLRNQRYINIEAERDRFISTADPLYVTNRQMAESVMARLGVASRPCPAPASGGGATGTTTGTTTGATTGTGATGTGTTATGTTGTAATACSAAPSTLTPCLTECRTFADLAQLNALKGCWRSQIDALSVNDAVCWMTGQKRPPDAVRTETVRQRTCMLDDLRAAAGARGSVITLPSARPNADYANWMESDYRPAVPLRGVTGVTAQRDIWQSKYNFTIGRPFDRITQDARNACGSLIAPGDTQWDPSNDSHRVCWGVTPRRPRTAPALPAGAHALGPVERQREILQASSAPGISRHHWGTDFDLFSVQSGQWAASGATPNFSAAHDWLAGRAATATTPAVAPHAGRYGFLQSFTPQSAALGVAYMAEDWHWSYYPVAQALVEYSQRTDVDTELNRQLTALWGTAPQYTHIVSNWRNFLRNVNTTPTF